MAKEHNISAWRGFPFLLQKNPSAQTIDFTTIEDVRVGDKIIEHFWIEGSQKSGYRTFPIIEIQESRSSRENYGNLPHPTWYRVRTGTPYVIH